MMWREQRGFIVGCAVQIAAHEIIRALEVVSIRKSQNTLQDRIAETSSLGWVHFISDFELNNRGWVYGFPVYHIASTSLSQARGPTARVVSTFLFDAGYPSSLRTLTYNQVIVLAAPSGQFFFFLRRIPYNDGSLPAQLSDS